MELTKTGDTVFLWRIRPLETENKAEIFLMGFAVSILGPLFSLGVLYLLHEYVDPVVATWVFVIGIALVALHLSMHDSGMISPMHASV